MGEIWKDIPGYEGLYQASSGGRIRSVARVTRRVTRRGEVIWQPIRERILRPGLDQHGYEHVILRRQGHSNTEHVHSLVARTFLGDRPQTDSQIRHLNGNSRDNSVSNLQYGTPSENQLDLYSYRGYHHRLRAEDVLDIRARLAAGETGRSIAKLYGVCESNISCIKHGGSFRWLT